MRISLSLPPSLPSSLPPSLSPSLPPSLGSLESVKSLRTSWVVRLLVQECAQPHTPLRAPKAPSWTRHDTHRKQHRGFNTVPAAPKVQSRVSAGSRCEIGAPSEGRGVDLLLWVRGSVGEQCAPPSTAPDKPRRDSVRHVCQNTKPVIGSTRVCNRESTHHKHAGTHGARSTP